MTAEDVPPLVECPCGTGHAERLSSSTSEPNSKNAKERLTTFFYKHEGCSIGGEIVTQQVVDEDDELEYEIVRTRGPLFNPRRYDALERIADGAPTQIALADGGKPGGS